MSFSMSSSMLKPQSARAVFQSSSANRVRARSVGQLQISARTVWQLRPDPTWSKKHEDVAKSLKDVTIELSEGSEGKRTVCTSGTEAHKNHEHHKEFSKALGEGVHLEFNTAGASTPMDAQSEIYVTNVDSTVDIKLDEEILSKGEQKGLKPGNVIYFGNTSAFQVERNELAHA